MLTPISSPANAEVRRLARLASAAGRSESGTFLVEGQRAIDGFLAAGWSPRQLLIADDLEAPPDWARPLLRKVSRVVADKISQHMTPSGYLAEFAVPTPPELDPGLGGLVTVGIADPGNLGTLLRSAAAFGVQQVLLVGGSDPFSPKVVRASAGALATLRLHRVARLDDSWTRASSTPTVALVVDGGRPLAEQPPWPVWLMVGSEAHGLDPDSLAHCHHRLTLPMANDVESLNAGVAGSLALFLLRGLHRVT